LYVVLLAVAVLLLAGSAIGQQLTATLSGTAYDPAGAVVPSAKIELVNQSSGDVRRTTTNTTGNFTLTAIPPGDYTLKVTAAGFTPWEIKDIVLNQGDARTVGSIALKLGAASDKIEVSTEGASVAVKDSGEVSTTLDSDIINEIAITGRDVGELMKIMPGMAMNNNGTGNNASFGGDKAVGSNYGPVGNYSANGAQPFGSMAYMLNGANLVDTGNVGTQIANINADMVAEVKFLAADYSAEYAKGPTVFQAFGKSGGNKFHGEGYFYARNSTFNAEDSYAKNQGVAPPDTHYYYPGFNIGGPIIIPGTNFNKSRSKLFFWFGYEYMDQHPAGSVQEYFVATPQMVGGNFNNLPSVGGWGGATTAVTCSLPLTATNTCPGSQIPNGQIPQSMFDPNGVAYLKLNPASNINGATHSGLNYMFINDSPQNRWEQNEKVDYSINDNNKLSVSYTHQIEHDSHPIDTWWAPSQAVPYPSSMPANTPSDVMSANFTHVFSPTLVNEFVFTSARYTNGLALSNAAAVDPSKLGMTYKGLFGANEKQMADTLSWSSALAEFMPQATFYGPFAGGEFGATKSAYGFYDNVTKIVERHTLKFGAYWEREANKQSTTGMEGQFEFETGGSTSTGNVVADELIGHAQSYQQANAIPVNNDMFNQFSLYAQDAFKASKRLTLNFGLRADHIGQYYDPEGKGAVVFAPNKYVSGANPPANDGLVWCKMDSSIPCSGWKSPLAYFNPRISAAYDLFGDAKTVLRGGLAIFRYQVGTGPSSNAYTTSSGAYTWNTNNVGMNLTSMAQINSITGLASAGNVNGGTINTMALNDGKIPSTMTYNITISQAAPWRSVLEASWVGSKSWDLLTDGSNSKVNDPNAVQPGALFKPSPVTGVIPCIRGVACNNLNLSDYYAYPVYQDIYIAGHGSFANYNSLQLAWTKSHGPIVFLANYTFSKVLGDRDGYSTNGSSAGPQIDPFNQRNDYGVLAYDHSHIFNATYVIKLGSPVHENAMLKQVANGWELSGTTQFQSGTPMQQASGGTLNAQWPGNVSNQTYLGTNAITFVAKVTCDPRNGRSSGQLFNPSCFAPPAPGTNGDVIWPYIKTPSYFNSDLSLYKTFKISESKSFQLRLQANNWLNHANPQFGLQGNNDNTLNFTTPSGALSQTNTNTGTTGKPAFTTGNRFIQLAVKFYF